MKHITMLILIVSVSLLIVVGCAPSVSVTPAGHERQYEVSVTSNDFTFSEADELIKAWHQRARETCDGRGYRVISRDVIDKEEPFNELMITGIIECD